MTEQRYVNRVDQTDHFEAEGKALEALSETVPLVEATLENPGVRSALLEQGFKSTLDPITPSSAVMSTLALDEHYVTELDPEDNIGNKAEPPDTPYLETAELISKLLKEKASRDSGESFAEFKKQVIAAFRHLGLDVKKFFLE
jgi:hypothetical protein